MATKRAVVAAMVGLVVTVAGGAALGGKPSVSWPGGTKPTATFSEANGTIYVTWPLATGDVTYYEACFTARGVARSCAPTPPDSPSVFYGVSAAGTYTVVVTAYASDGDVDSIKTRITVP
jgi:hypothetical protein